MDGPVVKDAQIALEKSDVSDILNTPVAASIGKSDDALENGNVDELAKSIAATVEVGIRERFDGAAEAGKHKDESVEAGRKFVAAYVQFVHYVEKIHEVAVGHDAHHGSGGLEVAGGHPQTTPVS